MEQAPLLFYRDKSGLSQNAKPNIMPSSSSARNNRRRTRSVNILSPYRLFYFFCAAVYPCIALGAVYLSFRAYPLFGITTALVLASWALNSFATTCRRCAFYGTSKCGLPGLVIPYFFEKRSRLKCAACGGMACWISKATTYEPALHLYSNMGIGCRPHTSGCSGSVVTRMGSVQTNSSRIGVLAEAADVPRARFP